VVNRPNPNYPEHPWTLGEQIRKKRIESALTTKVLGAILKVDECTIYNWKRGIGPRKLFKPRIVAFLEHSLCSTGDGEQRD
jgi:hypothetical protein